MKQLISKAVIRLFCRSCLDRQADFRGLIDITSRVSRGRESPAGSSRGPSSSSCRSSQLGDQPSLTAERQETRRYPHYRFAADPTDGAICPLTKGFRIQSDGTIENITLARSSGADSLDQAAISGVRDSGPVDYLPLGFKGTYVDQKCRGL
jgi:hypothetical protein